MDESKALTRRNGRAIVLSASGMATGGRVLHHLEQLLPDRRNTVLFVGFQAAGTRGEALVSGVEEVKIHGAYRRVAAEIVKLDSLSAHADRDELLAWLRSAERAPSKAIVNHGEEVAQDALRRSIEDVLGWPAEVAEQGRPIDVPTERNSPRVA